MKNIEKQIINICKSSLVASKSLVDIKNIERNKILKLIARNLLKKNHIFYYKIKKILIGLKKNLPKHLIDRLLLDENRISNMCKDILNIAKLNDPLGKVIVLQ